MASDKLVGKRIVSGIGEAIGVVIRVQAGRDGGPRRLWVREDGSGRLREIDGRFVRSLEGDEIHLKGPREGYHITRIGPDEGEFAKRMGHPVPPFRGEALDAARPRGPGLELDPNRE